MIKSYLQKDWLKSYTEHGLPNSHKSNLYYGKWAFEVAAVAKIKGLDCSTYIENPYFPSRFFQEEKIIIACLGPVRF